MLTETRHQQIPGRNADKI